MPDILIRMEMPRNCFECPLFTNCDACEGHECGCGLLGGIGYEEDISEDRRRDDCPLVELPEHGDLIETKDVLLALVEHGQRDKRFKLGDTIRYSPSEVKEIIDASVPVVVPAERGDTDA